MASGKAELQVGADLWDAAADERQRLADEREHLSNERENLADERERLADEHERLLDQRDATLSEDVSLGTALDDEFARVEAEDNLVRSEARLQRAVAERTRAQVALDRQAMVAERRLADAERSADPIGTDEDDDREDWLLERRGFVAVERERLAALRDEAQDDRDELAATREQEADLRDREARDRDERAARRGIDQIRGAASATAHQRVSQARSDLSQVRESADRQRRGSARTRQRAAVDRADASGRAASFIPDAYGPRLRAGFMDLTRELFASQNLSEVADRALGFALDCLPGYVAAGVTFVHGGATTARIATDPVAERLEILQLETGRGPTVEALGSPEPVHASFAAWPDLAVVATELGVEGALAYGLSVSRDNTWQAVGALTFYADTVSEIDPEVVDLGSVIAAYLAVAAGLDRDRMDLSRREAALHRALSSRDVIGQAKGILMERQHIPAGQAFDILRRTSQRLNLRLHEVAARLAESGEVPE